MDEPFSPIDLHSTSIGKAGTRKEPGDSYSNAVVIFVDLIKNTCDARAENGNSIFRNIQFAQIMPNHSGDIDYPLAGDTITVRTNKGSNYFEGRYRPVDDVTEDTGAPIHSFPNHPYLSKSLSGDRWWFGLGGAFLGMLRGGILKVGASPMCQAIFIKYENMMKLISQQWKFISCGLHAHSINDNGDISTRFSFFIKDANGRSTDNDWANRSDLDVSIDSNGLSLLFGPVDPETWMRQNRTMIRLMPNGNIMLAQGDIDNELYRQRIQMSSEGLITIEQFNEDMSEVTYRKQIVQSGDDSNVDEYVKGNYMLKVTGSHSVSADMGAYIQSDAHIRMEADIAVKIKTGMMEHEADIKCL